MPPSRHSLTVARVVKVDWPALTLERDDGAIKMVSDSSTDGVGGHRSRALVLGGGGPVGRAWELGLMDGFARQGIDLGIADLIIGTSAGAVVGARLALKQGFGASPNIAAAIASTPAQFIPTPWPIWAPLWCGRRSLPNQS